MLAVVRSTFGTPPLCKLCASCVMVAQQLLTFYIISMAKVTNHFSLFGLGVLSGVSFFKDLELLFEVWPTGAMSSRESWIMYKILPLPPAPDTQGRFLSIKPGRLTDELVSVTAFTFYVGFLLSFGTGDQPSIFCNSSGIIIPWVGVSLGRMGNTVFHIAIVHGIFNHMVGGLSIITCAFGYEPIVYMGNPIFKSRSIKEFWGRWNIGFHGTLKRAVFLPFAERGYNKLGSIVTFVVSGLFHEYRCYIINYWENRTPGKMMLFFAYNMLIIEFEYLVNFQGLSAPAFVKWVIIFTANCLGGHLFFDCMIPVFQDACAFYPIFTYT